MELLSESGRKTKRNLLFFALISWALALGYITPLAGDSTVAIYGLPLETTMGFVLAVLAIVQSYNLIAFVIYVWFQKGYSALERTSGTVWKDHPRLAVLENAKTKAVTGPQFAAAWLAEPWETWIPLAVGVLGIVGTAVACWQL